MEKLLSLDIFDEYEREEEQEEREFHVKKDEELERAIQGFYTCLSERENYRFMYSIGAPGDRRYLRPLPPNYDSVMHFIAYARKFSASTIEKLVIALPYEKDAQDHQNVFGFYFSALMNKSDDTEFVLRTSHYSRSLDWLGFRNEGNSITVQGDAGGCLAEEMKSGLIVVSGNIGSSAGKEMEGGRIYVKGKAGSFLGQKMTGGLIEVDGRADYGCGSDMAGGEIIVAKHANGEVGYDMSGGVIRVKRRIFGRDLKVPRKIKGGEIYHEGRLVLRGGK